MKKLFGAKCYGFDEAFYGTATVGERGQIVIPAEARADMEMQPGDKLLIMRHPIHKGLMLFKMEAMRNFLDDFAENLERLEHEKAEGEQD